MENLLRRGNSGVSRVRLPFLLGNLSLFPFDPLPEDNGTELTDGNGLTITTRTSSESRFGPRFGPDVSVENAKIRIPVSVAWKRVPLPEYEAHIKERQDRLTALQAEAKARGEKAAKEARFMRLENGTVVLKLKDGKEVKVPLSRLSPNNRELAESFGKK